MTYDRAHARLAILESAVRSSTRAADLAQQRFEAGLTDFLQVLDAERTLLDAENQLAPGSYRNCTGARRGLSIRLVGNPCRSSRLHAFPMNTRDLGSTLPTLFAELIDGAPQSEAYMLNRGDAGLLRSLDKLSATARFRPDAARFNDCSARRSRALRSLAHESLERRRKSVRRRRLGRELAQDARLSRAVEAAPRRARKGGA